MGGKGEKARGAGRAARVPAAGAHARAAAFALAQLNARAQFNGFLEGLRERADIEINDAELQKVGRRGQ